MMNYGQGNKIQTEHRLFEHAEDHLSDDRVKEIFDRYHFTKFITIDDLKYLWQKNPESCKLIIQNIIGEKDLKEAEQEDVTTHYLMEIRKLIKFKEDRESEVENGQQYITAEYASISAEAIAEIMSSLRGQITSMNDGERLELLNSMNDTTELEQLISKMRFWDDSFSENLTQYSYPLQNGFNKLA